MRRCYEERLRSETVGYEVTWNTSRKNVDGKQAIIYMVSTYLQSLRLCDRIENTTLTAIISDPIHEKEPILFLSGLPRFQI